MKSSSSFTFLALTSVGLCFCSTQAAFFAVFHPNIMTLSPKDQIRTMTATASDKPTQEWDVERYRDQHSFVWEYGTSLVDILQPQPGERILDVGCGSGELTAAIANTASRIKAVGFDADPDMVAQAKKQYPDLSFFQGDGRNFEVEEPYDAIFSNAALHWIPREDAKRAIVAMSKALKIGGRFVVEFGGKGNVQSILEAGHDVIPGFESPWYFPSIAEYCCLLEQHGIEVTSAALFDRPTPLDNGAEGMGNWIRCFGKAFFKGVREEQVEGLIGQMEEKLRHRLYDKDASLWTADYRRIRIIGKRIF